MPNNILAPILTSIDQVSSRLLTPAAVMVAGWKARGFLNNILNNHLFHAKQEIIEAVKDGIEKEREGHDEIVKAVQSSSDRIVDAMIRLK